MGLVFRLLRRVGVVKNNMDPAAAPSSRGAVLMEEAIRRGIPIRNLVVAGRPVDWYEAFIRGRRVMFEGLPRPIRTASLAWLDDKLLLKRTLESAGIPVPHGGSFSRWEDARERFKTLQKPVIVKPRLGSRGRHTTTFVHTEEQLAHAFRTAKQLCHWVIMEEHLTGSVYRGTVIGGKLAGVLAGDPPRITGDGVHTVEELVALKNASKPSGITDALITPATQPFLERQGLSLQHILPAGITIDLTEKIGVNYGGASREVTDETHEEIKKVMEAAGRVVNDPIIGFDFIIENISADPAEQHWGIIECNGVPFINLHHDPLMGTPRNVAKDVWDLWEPIS
jgi:cyanophycin synthetase